MYQKQVSIDVKKLAFLLFHAHFFGQQPDLKFAFRRAKILAPRLHASIQDEARRHEVTSLSVTMEVVITTAHKENFTHFVLRAFRSTVQR